MDKFIGKWANPLDDSLLEQSARRGKQYDFDQIAEDIKEKLRFEKNDVVLDVCCGNVALTKRIAPLCKKIHGVDFSATLLKTAEKIIIEEGISNLETHLSDAMKIDELFPAGTFDKAYCYFSFQYFSPEKRELLLEKLLRVTKPGGIIFIGDIPDKTRMWSFYETKFKFYRERISHILKGKEGECDLGWWVYPQEIQAWGAKHKLNVSILKQSEKLPHAHYRFDVLIQKTN